MMTTLPSALTGARRRVVLIDFDWQDADLLPRLLQQPGIAIRLVAGERTEEAGLRMAEVCGLPRTLDLADLTREIFDLALVGDRSPRHARVRSLLEALRTPCLSPDEFIASEEARAAAPKAAPQASAPRAAAGAAAPTPAPAETEPPKPRTPRHATEAPPPGATANEPAGATANEPASAAAIEPAGATANEPAGATANEPAGAAASKPGGRESASPAPAKASDGGESAGQEFESVVESTLGGMERVVTTVRSRGRRQGDARSLQNLQSFPSAEDRAALEAALRQLVANTGAVGAELHAGRATGLALVAQVGTHDPLLEGMVGLAYQFNKPQIVKGLSSPHEGKLWGAWPFRTIQHRAVLAASAIDPQGGVSPWEKMVDEMRERWDQKDREDAVQSFPLLHGQERAWHERSEFRKRLELAVERNKFDGLPFSLHRLEFSGPEQAVERMCEGLPQLLRGSDYLCHLPPRHVLLLTAVPAEDYTHVRRRLLAAWEQAWRECGQTPPAPPITDLRAEMAGTEDAEGFLESADAWLATEPASS